MGDIKRDKMSTVCQPVVSLPLIHNVCRHAMVHAIGETTLNVI